MALRPDDKLGPYAIVEQIAAGGMAEIYLAKTQGVAGFVKHCALKVIHADFASDEDFVQMLIDEAKIAVRLTHANIAQIHELGRYRDTYYIAMEYVDGADLFRVMRRLSELGVAVPIDIAVYVAQEICTGLHYAHQRRDDKGQPSNIIHRDISPQNVLISYAGEVKIVDFGIAKAAQRTQQTQAGVIKGKCYYMSPEQAWGKRVDHRTDVFSAGVVLYEVLTGSMLYLEQDATRLLHMAREAHIEQPSKRRQDIPPALERVVMKALDPQLEDRWQTAGELQSQLTSLLYSYAPDFTAERLARIVRVALDNEDPGSLPRMDPSVGRSSANWPAPDAVSAAHSGNYAFADESLAEFSDVTDRTMVSGPPDMLAHGFQEQTPALKRSREVAVAAETWFDDVEDLSQTRRVDAYTPTPQARSEPPAGVAEVIIDARQAIPEPDPLTVGARPRPRDDDTLAEAAPTFPRQRDSTGPRTGDELVLEPAAPHSVDDIKQTPTPGLQTTTPLRGPGRKPASPLPTATPALVARQPQRIPSAGQAGARPPYEPSIAHLVDSNPPSPATAPPQPHAQAQHPARSKPRLGRIALVICLAAAIAFGIGAAVFTFVLPPSGQGASIEFVSVPAGARISLDGRPLPHQTPATIPVANPSKPVRISLSLKGHRTWSTVVSFQPGEQHKRVVASLDPSLGRLIVESEPAGAEVILNGQSHGKTPIELEGLRLNRPLEVKIRKQGFEPITRRVTWGPDKWQRFKVVLQPRHPAKTLPSGAPTRSPR